MVLHGTPSSYRVDFSPCEVCALKGPLQSVGSWGMSTTTLLEVPLMSLQVTTWPASFHAVLRVQSAVVGSSERQCPVRAGSWPAAAPGGGRVCREVSGLLRWW